MRAAFSPAELDWTRMLDIALAELGPGLRLAPQLALKKILETRDGSERALRHRVDLVVLDAAGLPVAALEIAAGNPEIDREWRWNASRRLLERAGVACYEITAATTIEQLFAWLDAVFAGHRARLLHGGDQQSA